MHHYINAITDTKGNALIGYFVRCVDAVTGVQAPLYADTSLTPILSVSGVANAAQVDSDGNADFYITAGTYHLDIYATDSTSLVRRIANVPMMEEVGGAPAVITPQQFGAVGDNVTDDSAAFVAMIAHANSLATAGFGFGKGAPRIFIPAGKYYLGTTTLELTYSIIFEGESCGGPSGAASVLRWADNTTGIRTQSYDTTGATGPSTAGLSYPGAYMATIRNLSLKGGFSSTESESHGIQLRAKAVLQDLYIDGFGGDGVHEWAYGTSPTYNGNANDSLISNVFVINCRDGISLFAPDTNATLIFQPNCNSNRRWGVNISQTIGSNIIGGDCSSNGQVSGFPTMVSYSGHYYACIRGQETWCSTNHPSGTTAHNQGWYYKGEDGAATSARPAWTNGTTYRAGGAVNVEGNSNFCTVLGLYAETDQGPSQIDNCSTLWLAPLAGSPILNAGGVIVTSDPTYGGQLVGDAGNVRSPVAIVSGDQIGAGTPIRGSMELTGAIDEVDRYRPRDGSAHLYRAYGGNTIAVNSSGGGQFFYYDMATTRIGNLTLLSALKIDGTQVLGVRQTGWTAATGTPSRGAFAAATAGTVSAAYVQAEAQASRDRIAALEARLIALEADVRTHGLIN